MDKAYRSGTYFRRATRTSLKGQIMEKSFLILTSRKINSQETMISDNIRVCKDTKQWKVYSVTLPCALLFDLTLSRLGGHLQNNYIYITVQFSACIVKNKENRYVLLSIGTILELDMDGILLSYPC